MHKYSTASDFWHLIKYSGGDAFKVIWESGACYGGSWNTLSSRLIKTNIEDMTEEEALKILQLNPVSFDYKCDDHKHGYGLIAEDVLPIIPYVVDIPDGFNEETFDENKGSAQLIPGIDYAKFVPYLIKLIQILYNKIN